MNLNKPLKKYFKYIFCQDSFSPSFEDIQISTSALKATRMIRGFDRKPSIIIQGSMKRSGTVFTGEVLGLHPRLCCYPNLIWEIPLLASAKKIMGVQEEFFEAYEENRGKIGENDFLPLLGSAFISYLYSFMPEEYQMVIKVPGVEHLNYFYTMFPHEYLLLVIRDGRDVVTSTLKTWPHLQFWDVCRRWNLSGKMVFAFNQHYEGKEGYWLAKFEEIFHDPDTFVLEICQRFKLDPTEYPFEQLKNIKVIGTSERKRQRISWIEKPLAFNPIGRWKDWSPWRKSVFKLIAGKTLMQLGYSKDLRW